MLTKNTTCIMNALSGVVFTEITAIILFHCILRVRIKEFNSSITTILLEVGSYRMLVRVFIELWFY